LPYRGEGRAEMRWARTLLFTFTETKKQRPNTGARAKNILQK